jgi:hypothetical protein
MATPEGNSMSEVLPPDLEVEGLGKSPLVTAYKLSSSVKDGLFPFMLQKAPILE